MILIFNDLITKFLIHQTRDAIIDSKTILDRFNKSYTNQFLETIGGY